MNNNYVFDKQARIYLLAPIGQTIYFWPIICHYHCNFRHLLYICLNISYILVDSLCWINWASCHYIAAVSLCPIYVDSIFFCQIILPDIDIIGLFAHYFDAKSDSIILISDQWMQIIGCWNTLEWRQSYESIVPRYDCFDQMNNSIISFAWLLTHNYFLSNHWSISENCAISWRHCIFLCECIHKWCFSSIIYLLTNPTSSDICQNTLHRIYFDDIMWDNLSIFCVVSIEILGNKYIIWSSSYHLAYIVSLDRLFHIACCSPHNLSDIWNPRTGCSTWDIYCTQNYFVFLA
jgi:hypothetical protein